MNKTSIIINGIKRHVEYPNHLTATDRRDIASTIGYMLTENSVLKYFKNRAKEWRIMRQDNIFTVETIKYGNFGSNCPPFKNILLCRCAITQTTKN